MHLEISQIFTQIVSFLFMLWILSRYAWKPLLKAIDDRKKKIEEEFSCIAAKKEEAQTLLDEYRDKLKEINVEARAILKTATEKGQHLFQEIESHAHLHAQDIIHTTQMELHTEIVKAKNQLKDELVEMTLLATQKVIKSSLNADQQKKLIDEFIEEAGIH